MPLPDRSLHVLTVVGARPQFVKAAVVGRAIRRAAAAGRPIHESLVHTGQHHDHGMSAVFFAEMEIPDPVVDLGIAGGGHGAMTGRMLEALEREIQERRPDVVLVYGDTNSTLAGALAAAKLHVPVAHVEAGLRSFNRRMPEEVNRVLTDHASTLLFCPSAASAAQLAREGITAGVHVSGDVMIDAVHHYRQKAVPPPRSGPFALATLHRAENTDDPARLGRVIGALAASAIPVLLPLHPRTKKAMLAAGVVARGAVDLCEPLSYFHMLGCLQACTFVATDSGGLQKEAWAFGKKCLTLRDETEWTELVAADANRLVGTDPARIAAGIDWAMRPLGARPPIYGDGHAGEAIVQALLAADLGRLAGATA